MTASAAIFLLAHSAPVRAIVLDLTAAKLSSASGLVIRAKTLEYNLIEGWFEIKDVTGGVEGSSRLVNIKRVDLRIAPLDLMNGNFSQAVYTADGVALHIERDAQGRRNWPASGSEETNNEDTRYFQALRMRDVSIVLDDKKSGTAISLPGGDLSAERQGPIYKTVYRTARDGRIESGGFSAPINRLALDANLGADALLLERFEIGSGRSVVAFDHASLMFSGSELSAAGRMEVAAGQFSPKVSGRARADFSISGTASSPTAELRLASREVRAAGQLLQDLSLTARYAAGKLEIQNARGGILGARVSLGSIVDFNKPQVDIRALADVTGIAIDRLSGASGWKIPAASARIEASCTGIDWRNAKFSGVVRIGSNSELSFRARMAGQQVVLDLDPASGSALGASGSLRIHTASQSLTGALRGRIERLGGPVERIGMTGQKFPPGLLDASLDWQVGLGGSLNKPRIEFGASSSNLGLDLLRSAELDVAGIYDESGTQLQRFRIQAGEQEMIASGSVGHDSTLHMDGKLRNISLAKLAEHWGEIRDVSGTANGDFTMRGTLSRPQGQAQIDIADLRAYSQNFGPVEATLDLQDDLLTIRQLHATQPRADGSGDLSGTGTIDIRDRHYQFSATGKDLRIEHPALRGDANFEAKGSGTLDKPEFEVDAKGTGFATDAFTIGRMDAQVRYTGERAVLDLKAPDLNASGSAEVDLTPDYPFRSEIRLGGARINSPTHFGRPVSGWFEGSASGSGLLGKQELQTMAVNLKSAKVDFDGLKIENSNPIEMDLKDGRIKIEPLSINAGDAKFQVSGTLPLDSDQPPGQISISGTAALKKTLSENGIEVDGEVGLNAAITGSLRKWEPELNLTLKNGRVASEAWPATAENLAAEANIVDRVLRIERLTGKLAGGELRASGTLPLHLAWDSFGTPANDPGQPMRWTIAVEHSELRKSNEAKSAAAFSLHSEGEAAGLTLADIKGQLTFDQLMLSAKGGEMKQTQPTRITLDGSVARLEPAELVGPLSKVRLSGTSTLSSDPTVNLQMAGEADASFLEMMNDTVEAAGRISFDLDVSGAVQNPTGSGSVQLENASLAVRGAPVRAEGMNLRIDVDKDRLILSNLSGRLNGGKFSGEGEAKVRGGKLEDVAIHMQGDNVFLEYPPGFRTSSKLDLTLRSGERGLVLGGRVEVQDGVYRDPLDLRMNSSEAAIAKALPGAKKSDSEIIGLDIEVVTKQPVELDNNIGRLAANGNLRLRGTLDDPFLGGEIRLEEGGRLYFGDRTYDIVRGNVRFDGTKSFDPLLNLLATTRVSNYEIRLNLTGGMKDLTTTFTSDPPMSRNDVISVLLTGKTVSENRGVDLRKLEAYSLMTGAFNATMGGSAGRKLGVSQVSLQPGLISAESDPNPRLTITQDFTRTLRLVYSMNLSDSSDQIWIVEYDLTRSLRTRAVKESDNTYRSEVRHEVRFGGGGGVGAFGTASASVKRTIGLVSFQGGELFEARELRKQLRLKPGKKYSAIGVRKGADHLVQFLQDKGYLETRVQVNREEHAETVDLAVEMEVGPKVNLAYTGDPVPGDVRKRIRQAWLSGQTDRQRITAAQQALAGHFGAEGYLQVRSDGKVETPEEGKQVVFEVQRGRRYSNVHLTLDGASDGHAEEILEVLKKAKLDKAAQTEPRRVTDLIIRYYQHRGYLAAEVDPPRVAIDEDTGTGQIVVGVREGSAFRVGEIRFSGNQALKEKDLLAKSPLSAGSLFEPARLSAAVADMRVKYEAQGYRDLVLEYELKQEVENGVLDIAFLIQEKDQHVVQGVAIEGNRQISDEYVRRQLVVSEGKPENASGVNQSIQNLSRTGAFASVDIESKPSETKTYPSRVGSDLLVKVQEARPFRLLYGGLYNSKSGIGFIADIENHNSLGDGRVLGLRTRYDGDLSEVRLYLTQPVWRRMPISTTATTYGTEEEVIEGIRKTTVGASVQQDWPMSSKYLFSYGYRYEKFQFSAVPEEATQVPRSRVTSAPIFFTASRDTRDSFLDATRGSFIAIGNELAPGFLGSDYGHVRWSGQYFKYFPLTKPQPVPFGDEPRRSRLVYATAVRIGSQRALTESGIVLSDRFFAGGGTTIRGFKQDGVGPQTPNGTPIGGNAMLILNNELRFPMFWVFDGVAFSDVGNVYRNVSQFDLTDLRKSAGFGLRLRNPFVVLRFDYGVKLDRRPGESFGAFFFSIGQAF